MVEVEAGESVVIKARPIDPISQHIIADARASVTAFCDESNEMKFGLKLTFDVKTRYYVGTLDTTGFRKGVWTIQTCIEGGEAGYKSLGSTKVRVS